jgi:hypothetical protein
MPIPIAEFSPLVAEDLAPLEAAYPGGTANLPADLEDLAEQPLTNGVFTAVPWEYEAIVAVSRRGVPEDPRTVRIRGVTIVEEQEGEDAVFRRYVDWAGVWAQLGVSSGRGESGGSMSFLDPNGVEVDL